MPRRIIGATIDVHRALGPGLAERMYADALAIEMDDIGLHFDRELRVPVVYKCHSLGHYIVDFIVERCVALEIKSVDRVIPVYEAQLRNYMRLAATRVGLLINFNARVVKDGITRFIR